MKPIILVGVGLALGAPAYGAAPGRSDIVPTENGYKPPYTVEATVVAADPVQDTITFRITRGGDLKMARVAPEAAGDLGRVKPGQHVILVCRDAESTDMTLVEGLRKKGGAWKRVALSAAILLLAIFPKGY